MAVIRKNGFLAHLVVAYVEVPHFFRHAAKAVGFGIVQPDDLVGGGDFLDAELARADDCH